VRATEQERANVARARRRWMREQGLFDPARLVRPRQPKDQRYENAYLFPTGTETTDGIRYALAVFYGIMRLNVRLTRGPTGEAVFGT
jgi:hypothetical protein